MSTIEHTHVAAYLTAGAGIIALVFGIAWIFSIFKSGEGDDDEL